MTDERDKAQGTDTEALGESEAAREEGEREAKEDARESEERKREAREAIREDQERQREEREAEREEEERKQEEREAGMEEEGRQIKIQIDRVHYNVEKHKMTGAELRLLPKPPIGPDRDLFEVVLGGQDRKIGDTDEVSLRNGMRFFTAPAQINPGHTAAQP